MFLSIGLEYVDAVFTTIKESSFSQYTIAGIKKKSNKEDNPKDDRKNSPYGTGYIIDRIFNSPNLG